MYMIHSREPKSPNIELKRTLEVTNNHNKFKIYCLSGSRAIVNHIIDSRNYRYKKNAILHAEKRSFKL